MIMSGIVTREDVGLLLSCCSTHDSRGSDEMHDHIGEILQALIPQVSPIGYGQCYFDGTENELEELLQKALAEPVWAECQNGGEWVVQM